MELEKQLRDTRGIERRNGNESYLHGPMYISKTLKLRFRVGDLDLPERRKRYTSSREEEEVHVQMCPFGRAIESRTHVIRECEMHKEERYVLEEEMREIDERDMEEFGTVDSSEKTIAFLGDRCWPQAAKLEGDKISKKLICDMWKQRYERSSVEGIS